MTTSEEKDMLQDIFQYQLKLQKRLGYTPEELLENQEFINLNFLAILDEITEAMRETAWKNPEHVNYGWKKTQLFNSHQFKEELVDILHFSINLCISAGMSPTELYLMYVHKNEENHERQTEGY